MRRISSATFYRTFAGRDGSAAEVAAWVNLMQQGLGAEKIAYLMMTSAGFNGLHPDNASFLQAVFTDTLGRPPAPAELAAVGGRTWRAGSAGRRSSTPSSTRPQAAQNAVLGFASLFWGLPIDPATEAADAQYLPPAGTLADVAAAFASSPAFSRGPRRRSADAGGKTRRHPAPASCPGRVSVGSSSRGPGCRSLSSRRRRTAPTLPGGPGTDRSNAASPPGQSLDRFSGSAPAGDERPRRPAVARRTRLQIHRD